MSGSAAFDLQRRVLENPALIGTTEPQWLLASDAVDLLLKGHVDRASPEDQRPLNNQQLAYADKLQAENALALKFNTTFLTGGDSREPERAGIWGAVVGSFFTLIITLLLSFPIGVAAAIYLEEFARRSRWTDLIEVNINNLAAVPSIVFGLLGLAVFIGFFGLPRSAPLVGAMVLTLLTLPTIIIASRAALKAVPPSIREAALGMGASKIQMVTHHVLPLAMPGMLTGTIIGMARALGESAPLLMIGMVAFIVDIPKGITDSFDGVARAGVLVVRQSRTRFRREDLRRHHRAPGLPGGHEHDGSNSSQTFRTTVVKIWKARFKWNVPV